MNLTVQLKNAPSGANRWGLTVLDWTGTYSLSVTITSLDGVASFNIPTSWQFPLRFYISIVYYPDGSVTILHEAQSVTTIWPNFIEEYIPGLGSYFYNVTTRKFELKPITGDIIKGELVVLGNRFPIGSVLDTGSIFQASFTVKNTSADSIELGMYWQALDPGGNLRQETNLPSGSLIGPSMSHLFEGNYLTLNIAGSWTISAELWGRFSGGIWVQLDTFQGVLCRTPLGVITDKWVDKSPEGTHLSIPATVSADGNAFEVGVRYKSTWSTDYFVTGKVTVTDPGGVVYSPTPNRVGISPNEELGFKFQLPAVNKTGIWTILIQFLLDDGSEAARFGPATCLNVPSLTGKITGTWINKGSAVKVSMPATVDADGQTFEIGVGWKNTYTTSYDARIDIIVRNPAGSIVKSIESPYYGMTPGQTRENNWNIVKVDKAGEWTTSIRLIARDGSELGRFDGVCLNATGWLGTITSMWFNKGSLIRAPFSTKVEANGQAFEVGARYKNTTVRSVIAGVQVEVWDPDGVKQPTPAVDYTGIAPNEELTKEYQFGAVDKTGEWMTKLKFITKEGGLIIDEWPAEDKGLLFNATPLAKFSNLSITSYTKKSEAAAQQLSVQPGDIIVVGVSFKYTTPAPIDVVIVAALWIPPGVDYPNNYGISLDTAIDKIFTGSLEIPIRDDVGLRNDTYHLLVTLPDYGLSDQVDNAVTCTGMPAGVGDVAEMIGMLVIVMMMSMVMNIMTAPEGIIPAATKKYEEIKGAVQPVIQIFTKEKEV